MHAGVEAKRLELLARIAARLGELGDDVVERRQADLLGHIVLEFDLFAQRGLADEIGHSHAEIGSHLLDDRVALGVDGAGVERVGGIADA